jgi:hypothetical protein
MSTFGHSEDDTRLMRLGKTAGGSLASEIQLRCMHAYSLTVIELSQVICRLKRRRSFYDVFILIFSIVTDAT